MSIFLQILAGVLDLIGLALYYPYATGIVITLVILSVVGIKKLFQKKHLNKTETDN